MARLRGLPDIYTITLPMTRCKSTVEYKYICETKENKKEYNSVSFIKRIWHGNWNHVLHIQKVKFQCRKHFINHRTLCLTVLNYEYGIFK